MVVGVKMKKLVVLTGAGISAESGLKTFRDMGGLWEQYDVTEVASPEAWRKNPELVMRFYNERRKVLFEATPNAGHMALAALQEHFEVTVITQNVDDLHEQAGSKSVVHLHGELRKAQSTVDSRLVYTLKNWELKMGDLCEKGSQLRPYIVWFGEPVPNMSMAAELAKQADIFAVIGTSLNVYPAAGLLDCISRDVRVYLIDPNMLPVSARKNFTFIKEYASVGVSLMAKELIDALNGF
ncbi:SIR2 family NAD-dependent protein deacylase [Williamwhitmania taraxaci]|uniref:protein acetyllysine N-acetyltransferase n=1 Tax=Williamwhitmania taraxaci TaxID=1640674 RepID=A0A1G6L013_9BACT|nr:NAD-dependent deacylase [Williamwhitmania taraxaci]SDC36699.1 NAD-dependent deacetylase [Williamwhitmania taraxaci]